MHETAGRTVAVAVIVQEGRVLLIRRRVAEAGVLWSFPGGKVEPGETAQVAAVRETLEETGLAVIVRRVLGERVHPATSRAMTYVSCQVTGGIAHAAAPAEVAEVAWCDGVQLGERVPGGVFRPVQDYLKSVLGS